MSSNLSIEFSFSKYKLQVLLFLILLCEVLCNIEENEVVNNEIIVSENKNDSFSITYLDLQNNKTRKAVGAKRKRKRKKKKNPGNKSVSTTVSSVQTEIHFTLDKVITTTTSPSKKQKRKKSKRKRNNGIRKIYKFPNNATRVNIRNKTIPAMTTTFSSPMQVPKNLVLPMLPNMTIGTTSTRLGVNTIKKITRCSKHNGGCAHLCLPTGDQKCQCLRGFKLAEDKRNCIDINECAIKIHGCQMKCTNTIGSFRCECPRGLRLGLDSKSCEDVNECLLRNGHGPCQDICENTYGSYKCSCLNGTKLTKDQHKCVDEDECLKDNGGCSHICINTFGRSFCSCPNGHELSLDFKTCKDVNECEIDSIRKSCPSRCINTIGSYRCADVFDLQNDGILSDIVCDPLFPPKHGFFKCSRKHAVVTYMKSGRRRIRNSLGTKCLLVCPEGFKRIGRRFRISCGLGGQWLGNLDSRCVPIRHQLSDTVVENIL